MIRLFPIRPAAITLAGLAVMALVASSCGRPAADSKPANPPPAAQTAVKPAPEHAGAGAGPHWTYEGDTGPENWGKLDAGFVACAEGRSQSPIDLTGSAAATEPGPSLKYGTVALHIAHHAHLSDGLNNGHTIQVNCPGGDSVLVNGKQYGLVQFHFHSPSEHTVDGRHSPMEMHLVHKAADGALAVLGVLIEEGAENAAFAPIWSNLPAEKGVSTRYDDVTFDVSRLLPADHSVYRYDGSLTTPPCSEGVAWSVFAEPVRLSAGQIGQFRALINGNNRPVQPLNGRTIARLSVGN